MHEAPVEGFHWTPLKTAGQKRKKTTTEGNSARKKKGALSPEEDESGPASRNKGKGRALDDSSEFDFHDENMDDDGEEEDALFVSRDRPRQANQTGGDNAHLNDFENYLAANDLNLDAAESYGEVIEVLARAGRVTSALMDEQDEREFTHQRTEAFNNSQVLKNVRKEQGKDVALALFQSASLIMRVKFAQKKLAKVADQED